MTTPYKTAVTAKDVGVLGATPRTNRVRDVHLLRFGARLFGMQKSTRSLPSPRFVTAGRALTAAMSALLLVSALVGGLAVATAPTVGAAPQVQAKPGDTTTTLPEDRRVLGHSITRPNEGMAPQDAGDPGGWLQSSLFFLICGAVILMATAVWYQSHKARSRRAAAGMDPVAVAKAAGRGVRAPSPLDKPADSPRRN